MAHFVQKLEELMAAKKLKPIDLHRLTGISQSQISKWVNGEQAWVSADDLTKICQAIAAGDIQAQAELSAAHCRDECYGPGAHLVEIGVRGSSHTAHETGSYTTKVKLPQKIEHDFDVLRKNVLRNRDLKSVLHGLASALEKGTLN